jgi:hypothetical protein
MTGLDLESFLRLLRADWAAWASLGMILMVLALMTWTTWGSRRVLRKCLVLSIVVHVGVLVLGGPIPAGLLLAGARDDATKNKRIHQIRVRPEAEPRDETIPSALGGAGRGRLADWDRPGQTPPVGDLERLPNRQVRPAAPALERDASQLAPVRAELTSPDLNPPDPAKPEARAVEELTGTANREEPAATRAEAADLAEIPEVVVRPSGEAIPTSAGGSAPSRPTSVQVDGSAASRTASAGDPESTALAMPDAEARQHPRATSSGIEPPRRTAPLPDPLALARVLPTLAPSPPVTLPPRELSHVPEVYRPRLAPNRSARAQQAGASLASEQAVARGLDWLARHQDSDGRWNGGVLKDASQNPVRGSTSYTVHCPPGEICAGESAYDEADTAMTGLALLAYLGAGYTHTQGKYAETVGRGIEHLLAAQKASGDLRGSSRVIGMYCHAIATLALCEGYALTGDERLRGPIELAIGFLVKSRSADGMAWRYQPGDPTGSDTSVLGWIILALKSAKESGFPIPSEARDGALRWLALVASGRDRGLAAYRRGEQPTPSMTAEAWVCRQFLGTGGPGATSIEAAQYLLAHPPSEDAFNLYYWYYSTLAMFQHGGSDWRRWNFALRDHLVGLQRTTGHIAGSWDPGDDLYASMGGRIYSTALATLTLEVYYRYLRLYAEPAAAPRLAPSQPGRDEDGTVRRAARKPAAQ